MALIEIGGYLGEDDNLCCVDVYSFEQRTRG